MKKLVYSAFFKNKFRKWILLTVTGIPLALLFISVTILYWQQDKVVQRLIADMNKDFKGCVEIKGSHISLFENFPYISIDLETVEIHENKAKNIAAIANLKDIYLGFDFWTILAGNMEIKKLTLKNGRLNLIQHLDGEFNIVKALSSDKEIDPNKEFHLDLKKIELENIHLVKLNEQNNLLADAYISHAASKFKTSPQHIYAYIDSKFELNIVSNNDTTFIKHKHFELKTEIDFLQKKEVMTIRPSIMKLEGAEFNVEGTIDFLNDVLLDLKFNGNKPNFDLFIAMAPEELIPTLRKYDNRGKIYFNAAIKGKSINGNNPSINADFGCADAYFNNTTVNKKLDAMRFKGHFTNGEKRNASTMELSLQDFSARPEAGIFRGNLTVKNFSSPEINLQLKSEFELDFLAKFFNLKSLQDLSGKIWLTMNFRDIIDLEFPEKSIEKLNESYFTQLKIEDLSFTSSKYALPIRNLDLYAELNGHKANIEYANVSVGKSDLHLSGTISDLPAIIHHTATPVNTSLNIKSKYIDLFELTGSDSVKSIDEQIQNLSLNLEFKSSAKAFTESPNLPVGEFFVTNLYAGLKHYPHTLHDFHADIFIDGEDFRIVDFKGMIDKSDFFFSGKLRNYNLWFDDHSAGDTKVEFNLTSSVLQLEDIFSYKGENYVPEDYRHEEFKNLVVHGYTDLHFKDSLRSIDFYLDRFDAKMKLHPLRFENFKGRVHYEDEHLVVDNFSGKIGKSDLKTTLHYYFGKNEAIKKRDNHFELTCSLLDFDELFIYHPPDTNTVEHDKGFNIYELPFTDMTFDININRFNYHRYVLNNVTAKWRTTPNHYVYIDKMHLNAAGGAFDIGGYFNGSNPKQIYFSPNMKVKNVDLDKLLFKFENFGQDHLVSENLHGKFSGNITGKIHMHTDLVPKIDDSEIHLDVEVVNGRLENYKMLDHVAEFFHDKNLKKVFFDTLANHIDLTKGVLNIPKMRINSSLGFMEISGKQDMDFNMEYYLKIPWKMVTQAGSAKLFGKKAEEVDPEQTDAIQYADPEKKIRYVNIKIAGNPDNYKVSLGKDKSDKLKEMIK
ncbi:MAG: AsmA-like C-terminal region-containing protein [Bacteroidota bacterium]